MPDQFSQLAHTAIGDQLSVMKAVTEATFHCISKLNRLNMSLVSTSVQESNVILQAMLQAQAPAEVTSLWAAQLKPGAQKMLAYGHHLSTIASGLQKELQHVGQQQLSATERKLAALTHSADASAAQSETLRAALAAMVNLGHGVDQMNEVVLQATSATQAVMDNAVQRWREIAPETLSPETARSALPTERTAKATHRWH